MNSADKNSAPRLPRPASRARRYAAAMGSLAIAGTLVLSGLVSSGGVEQTEAAWTDTEHAQAAITAEWPSDSWTRATHNAFTNYADYTPGRSPANFTHARFDDRPSLNGSREWVGFQGDAYVWLQNFGIRTHSNRAETKVEFCSQAGADPQPYPSESIPGCTNGSEFSANFSQARTKGFGVAGGFAHPGSTRAPDDDILNVEAQNVQTMAECAPNGESMALAPSATSTWGGGSGWLRPNEPYGQGEGIGFVFTNALDGFTAPTQDYSFLQIPKPNERITRWMRPLRKEAGFTGNGYVFFRATITSRQYATYGYALSDLYVTIDQFNRDSGNPYTGSFTMILSRSECGVKMPSFSHNYLRDVFEPRQDPRPTYPSNPGSVPVVTTPAPLPRQDGTLAYPDDLDYPAQVESDSDGFATQNMTLQGLLDDELAATDLPPMTNVTSPLENTTASETTTSAPPNPSDEDESTASGMGTPKPSTTSTRTTSTRVPTVTTRSTTSAPATTTQTVTQTSTTPAPSIPSGPSDLTATEETETAGTVEVDGEELAVVVKGDTVPTDARSGTRALDTWINDGTRPSGNWKTFTSDDPDEDGWRWAAINQRTGTVVYIR